MAAWTHRFGLAGWTAGAFCFAAVPVLIPALDFFAGGASVSGSSISAFLTTFADFGGRPRFFGSWGGGGLGGADGATASARALRLRIACMYLEVVWVWENGNTDGSSPENTWNVVEICGATLFCRQIFATTCYQIPVRLSSLYPPSHTLLNTSMSVSESEFPCSLCAFSAHSSGGLTRHHNVVHQDALAVKDDTYTCIGHPHLTGIPLLHVILLIALFDICIV
jgi:hypothetical protein